MHELALSRAILDVAVDRAEGRPVTRVAITIGALRQVVPDSLAFNFSVISRGTVCEGAVLEPRLVPARLSCPCGNSWILDEPVFICPSCDGRQATVVDGDELSVDYIEVEEEEERCTGPR